MVSNSTHSELKLIEECKTRGPTAVEVVPIWLGIAIGMVNLPEKKINGQLNSLFHSLNSDSQKKRKSLGGLTSGGKIVRAEKNCHGLILGERNTQFPGLAI